MALLNYAYQLDIRDSSGLPLSGLANVELRTASLSYAFTGLGNGVYRRAVIPAGRYMLWINGVSSGQSYAVGAGELAGLGYVDSSYLACETNGIKWEPKPEYVGASHLTDPDAHAELFLANAEESTLETALRISEHEAKDDPHPQYQLKEDVADHELLSNLIGGDVTGHAHLIPATATKVEAYGQANGMVVTDVNNYIPISQIPASLLGAVRYQGTWDASTNTPILAQPPSATTKGYYYLVSVAGTFNSVAYAVGDMIISDGTAWQKIDNTEYSPKESDTLSKERTGFVDGNNIAFSYNETTRTVTLTGDLSYLWRGERKALTSPWTSPVHGSVSGTSYFLSSADGVNFIWRTTIWDFSDCQIAFAYYGASDKFGIQETHGCAMSHSSHQHGHDTAGTYRKSGGSLSAGSYLLAPASPTNAGNRPGVDATELWDEDKKTVVPALADNGPYTQLYGNASNVSVFTKDALNIVPIGTTYPQYNLNGVLTELANNKMMNVYRISVPVCPGTQSAKYGVIWVVGVGSYSSLGEAQSESLILNLGNFSELSPEYTECQRITISTSASYTTVGKFRIAAVTEIGGTKQAPYAVGGTGVTSHWSLSNVQGGATSDQFHLTQVQHSALTGGSSTNLHLHDLTQISNMSPFMRTVNDDATAADARATLGAAPISHASNATTYGVGSSTEYGHVKVDTIPTDGSSNAVSSNGVFDALAGKAANPASVSWSNGGTASIYQRYMAAAGSSNQGLTSYANYIVDVVCAGSYTGDVEYSARVVLEANTIGGSVTRNIRFLYGTPRSFSALRKFLEEDATTKYVDLNVEVPANCTVKVTEVSRDIGGEGAVASLTATAGSLGAMAGDVFYNYAPTAPAGSNDNTVANTSWVRGRLADTTVGNADKVDGMHVVTVNLADKGTDSSYYYFCV